MNPELGKRAVEETAEEIQEAIKGADMVFIAGGMGGGTGTGAAPVIAKKASEAGILTVAVVTKPFFFEGVQRMKLAEQGIEELKAVVDAIIIIPNDRLLQTIDKDTTAKNAFAICDNILKEAVEGITDLITTPGIINIDFADISAILKNAGVALMGIGTAAGDNRAVDAAKAAISSPLLELSINGARGVLFSIAGGDDLTMFEIQDAAKIITESVDSNARIIFGAVRDEHLKKGEVKITVIASNFPEGMQRKATSLFQSVPSQETEKKAASIFNAAPKDVKDFKQAIEDKKAATPTPTKPEEEEDEWNAVPAFLRRSKLK
jgi:cell division protein FtsZ